MKRQYIAPLDLAEIVISAFGQTTLTARLWSKHQKVRIYVSTQTTNCGYIDLSKGIDTSNLQHYARVEIDEQIRDWLAKYLVKRPSDTTGVVPGRSRWATYPTGLRS